MRKVKTVWEWSEKTEAKRLIHTAHNIAVGFFRVNNFLVVPYGYGRMRTFRPEGSHPSLTVPFPQLPYQTIPRFWERVKREDIKNFPLGFEPDLVEAVEKLLEPLRLAEPEMKETKENWGKASKDVLNSIRSLLSEARQETPGLEPAARISQIIIHPTNFGTTCSFSIADKFPAAVEMYLRADQDIYAITEAILSAITRNEVYRELDGMWSESELLVDWLLMKSSLSPILKKYQPKTTFMPTVKYTRMKQSAKLMKQSEEFYRRLGAPILDKVFAVENGVAMIQDKRIENLSQRERQILGLLIQRGNNLVTIDELSELIFDSEENFSLWAIAKTIQRLRDKLEQNGVSGSFIQTLRGQGYVLKN